MEEALPALAELHLDVLEVRVEARHKGQAKGDGECNFHK